MNFGKLTGFVQDGQTVYLDFEGVQARIDVVSPLIFRVSCGAPDGMARSHAVIQKKPVRAHVMVERNASGLWIGTGLAAACVTDGFFVDFFNSEGRAVCTDWRGERKPLPRASEGSLALLAAEGHDLPAAPSPACVQVVKEMPADAHFYGLGDKTGFLDKRGYEYTMWNTDDPKPQVDSFQALYKSIPFFIALAGRDVYGILFDNTCKSTFNMGQESDLYYFFRAEGGALDYYYLAGDSMEEIVSRYTWLTGRHPLPQKWTLGYHQSRWGYVTQEDVEEVAGKLRALDIPCDAIHFDIDYMDGFRVFTWDGKKYHGDPRAFLQSLAGRGFKPVTIIDPGVKQDEGYFMYDEGMAGGYFAKTPEGEVYVNAVWPGAAVFPDFGKPEVRAWWAEKQRILTQMGVRGVWNDMNEPASFNGPLPDDVQFTDEDAPAPHAEMHNVYGHLMARATYEGLKAADGRRPFVITRACYAGSQRYATAWTGDNHSIWCHLRMAIPQLCNLGLSGMPFVGTDVGGFGSDATPELLARWVQVGCFSPLFRNHSALGTRRQEPWQFGKRVLDIYRKYVKLRYHLLPLFYDLFREEACTGLPILRPLVLCYEDDETARTCNDEFMIGRRLLVAPVVDPGVSKRMVYLPEGEWYDYWTGEKHTGGGWFLRDAPLDVCPLYVLAGSALPVWPECSYVGEKAEDVLYLEVFPGEGTWTHYLDNGEDFAYQDGAYHEYALTVRPDVSVSAQVTHAGYDRPYRKIVSHRFSAFGRMIEA